MTLDEATGLIAWIATAYPSWKVLEDKHSTEIYLRHLLPLPYEKARLGVEAGVLTNKFPPTLAEVMTWCGIEDDDARRGLLAAMREGGELRRDIRQPNGWRLVLPNGPPPDMPMIGPGPTQGKGIRLLLKEQRAALERQRAKDAEAPPAESEGA